MCVEIKVENGLEKEVGNLNQGVNAEAKVISQFENEAILAYARVMGIRKWGQVMVQSRK